MKQFILTVLLALALSSYGQQHIMVLGIAQDGGFPHIGCQRQCQLAHQDPTLSRFVVSLALVDPESRKWWLFDATPDMDRQFQFFQEQTGGQYPYLPEGIFITHAHIGHYTGLMFLGREALGADNAKVYTLPKMAQFLKSNGPWSQLVALQNIQLKTMEENNPVSLTSGMQVRAFRVPHRDEFSETAGFHIATTERNYLFIPDIDKWDTWDKSIVEEVKKVDHAFLDATFYKEGELPNRPMREVPHPFVEETMALFKNESPETKRKIVFVHLNHTNPLLFDEHAKAELKSRGFRLGIQGHRYD